jgi:hypothetical protein
VTGYLFDGENNNNPPFPGKIVIATSSAFINPDDFYSPKHLIRKYGSDKVLHIVLPDDLRALQSKMINIFASLAADREIKILIINQAVQGTNAAVDKNKEIRDDIFIIYCTNHEPPADSSLHANLILDVDKLGMGIAMVKQAKKQGARVFVHYSFPRHMALPVFSTRRDLIRETCATEDIQFIDAAVPDPTEEAGITAAQHFLFEDVPKTVSLYGENTAFYSTNCQLQEFLIKAVVETHAIYPQPCCPSPFHGFPRALGIEIDENMPELNHVIGEASRIAAEKNMSDRLSTWPVSASMMFTNAGAEYAIRWINGQVSKTGIDDEVLAKCMSAYIKEVIGEAVEISMISFSEGEGITTYNNTKLFLMSYLDL